MLEKHQDDVNDTWDEFPFQCYFIGYWVVNVWRDGKGNVDSDITEFTHIHTPPFIYDSLLVQSLRFGSLIAYTSLLNSEHRSSNGL